MRKALQITIALLSFAAISGVARAEGGPGDSGAGATDGSASAVMAPNHPSSPAKRSSHMTKAKQGKANSGAGNGAKADGPMSNASAVGKGG